MPKHHAKLAGIAVAMIAAIAALAPLAQADTPLPGYTQFAGCPNKKTENPAVNTCLHGLVDGGHVKIGKKEVPISVPINFSGGVSSIFTPGPLFVSPSGGLEPVKEPIPGGLIGSTKLDWLSNFIGAKQLALYEVTEVAGLPLFSLVTGFHLPVKIHLINPLLGNNCYIGSNANPISLNLITGTTSPPPPNKPITGSSGFLEFEPVLEIQRLLNQVSVDNSFAVPAATGCVLNLSRRISIDISSLVNAKLGLPAPAGVNEMIQEADFEAVNAEFVYP